MTFQTSLDQNAFFNALWVQNLLYGGQKLIRGIQVTLILVVLALTIDKSFINPTADWSIRIVLCAVVLGVYNYVSKNGRRKAFMKMAQDMVDSNNGPLNMTYRLEDDAFYATGPDGEEHEFSYKAVSYLVEYETIYAIVLDRDFLHAIRKADLSSEMREQLMTKFYVKTAKNWTTLKQ